MNNFLFEDNTMKFLLLFLFSIASSYAMEEHKPIFTPLKKRSSDTSKSLPVPSDSFIQKRQSEGSAIDLQAIQSIMLSFQDQKEKIEKLFILLKISLNKPEKKDHHINVVKTYKALTECPEQDLVDEVWADSSNRCLCLEISIAKKEACRHEWLETRAIVEREAQQQLYENYLTARVNNRLTYEFDKTHFKIKRKSSAQQ